MGTAFQIRENHSEEGKKSETLLERKPGSELLSGTTERRKEKKKKGGGEAEEEKKIAGAKLG